jgi:hypothetical protein
MPFDAYTLYYVGQALYQVGGEFNPIAARTSPAFRFANTPSQHAVSMNSAFVGNNWPCGGIVFNGPPSAETPIMNSRSFAWPVLLLVAALLLGCGAQQNAKFAPGVAAVDEPAARVKANVADVAGHLSAERKIIYTAMVALVVKDFSVADRRIQSLTQEFGGFIAEFREDRTYGDRLAGRWVIRTPVKRFNEFLAEIVELGVPETRQIDAQDVTEEFVDLEARLANKRKLEERILDLLENQTGEIKDVIAVETELARVREEIERMEGRLRYLKDQVELTTITITAREDVDYVPPQAPTFTGKVHNTWTQSLAALQQAAEGLALFVVAVTPWVAVLAILLTPFFVWLTRRRKNVVAAEAVN